MPQFDIPRFLAGRFFALLKRLEPDSVLDVGCGRGRLLRQCVDAGIAVHGVEPSSDTVTELTAGGLECSAAAAESLPFDDGSFDWVTMRHISHHLADERPALAEAFRVCRSGVLVAEPWLDLSIASQRVARRFDAWLEEQNRRVGHIHRVPLSAGDFLAALPDGVEVDSVLEQVLVLQDRPSDWLRSEAEQFLGDIDAAGKEELESIEAAAAADGLTYNGTSILRLRLVNPQSAKASSSTPRPSTP